jgi:outer membrane protein, heavy metal efflux system
MLWLSRATFLPLGLIGALVLVTGRAAGPEERVTRLSVDDAVRLAIQHNATLRAKAYEYESTRANEITAALRPNPTASVTRESWTPGNPNPPSATISETILLSQTIETGGKRQRRIESARAATRVSGYQLADVRRQITLEAKRSFTDILVAEAALALANDNLKTIDELERIQRLRAQRGDISQLELTRIEVARFDLERDAADAAQALRAAKIALRATVGADVLADDFSVTGELRFHDVPVDREELHQLMLANRPDVRAAEADVERAKADTRLARANAWWDITPQVDYSRVVNDNTIGFGFSIPLRIFDRNQGEIARTQADVARTRAVHEATMIQARSEIDTVLASLLTARKKVEVLEQNYLPKARQARDTVEYAYKRGGLSLLDFLDAQRTYRETALNHLRALGDYQGAIDQLEAAVGGALGGGR